MRWWFCLWAWSSLLPLAGAVELQFDYTYDTEGFFDQYERRQTLETAGSYFLRLRDPLSAIVPNPPINTIEFTFSHPGNGDVLTLPNLAVPADTIIVFVGARPLDGATIGMGGPVGWSANGSSTFLRTVARRGQKGETMGADATDYQVAVASMTFDSTANWNFDLAAPAGGQEDFLTVALHELGHVLGVGTAASWIHKVDEEADLFLGPLAQAVHGEPVPLNTYHGHWAMGTMSEVDGTPQVSAMDPVIRRGTRKYYTSLDIAALGDVGWQFADDGDLDLDGDTDTADLLEFLAGWTGSQEKFEGQQTFLTGDIDFDGDSDSADLLRLLGGWTGADAELESMMLTASGGAPSPGSGTIEMSMQHSSAAGVPEPSGAAGWIALVLALAAGRRRVARRMASWPGVA